MRSRIETPTIFDHYSSNFTYILKGRYNVGNDPKVDTGML